MFKLSQSPSVIIRIADKASIPRDERNADYQAFLAWQAAGGVIQAADAPAPPTQYDLDRTAANAYTKLVTLRGMTPAQVQTWVDANVTDLASAKDAIKTLAIAVGVLARQLNGGA